MRLWGTGRLEAQTDAGPTAHSVPVDVLGEEDPNSCLRAAEPVQGERGNANVCPGGPHLEPPIRGWLRWPAPPTPAPGQIWSLRQDHPPSGREGNGTANASSMCFLGTPPLGVAARSLEGQRGPWLEGAGRPGALQASVRFPKPKETR